MTHLGLALCLALIVFGSVNALASLVTVVAMRRARTLRAPGQRAGRFFMIRLLPTAVSLFVVLGLVLPAFLLLEPHGTGERVTPLMIGLAAAAAMILALGPLRAARAGFATHRLVRAWRHDSRRVVLPGLAMPAWVIDVPYPLVTVVGVFRPRLYIARGVLEGCSQEEMAAILRHEIGHVERRDNWKRMLLAALPDWLGLTPWATRLEEEWSEAAEDAADDHAARGGSPVELASALVTVARLTRQAAPPFAPASTLYRGQGLERRVVRLLHPAVEPGPRTGPPVVWSWCLLMAAGLALSLQGGLLGWVQGLNEVVVRLLQ